MGTCSSSALLLSPPSLLHPALHPIETGDVLITRHHTETASTHTLGTGLFSYFCTVSSGYIFSGRLWVPMFLPAHIQPVLTPCLLYRFQTPPAQKALSATHITPPVYSSWGRSHQFLQPMCWSQVNSHSFSRDVCTLWWALQSKAIPRGKNISRLQERSQVQGWGISRSPSSFPHLHEPEQVREGESSPEGSSNDESSWKAVFSSWSRPAVVLAAILPQTELKNVLHNSILLMQLNNIGSKTEVFYLCANYF